MTMPKNYKNELLAAVHEMMEGLHEAGAIDKRTLREFDEACLCRHKRSAKRASRRSRTGSPCGA
jgi:DNA-binding transcriptional regulator YiaG